MSDEIILDEGKYHFYIKDGLLYCDRYEEKWRDFLGDHAVHALFNLCIVLVKSSFDYQRLLLLADRFCRLDDEIHSRPEDTPWNVVERQAAEYTQCRKELMEEISRMEYEGRPSK